MKSQFLKDLENAITKNDQEIEKGKSDFNIFKALGMEYKETYHSAFLRYLLNKDEAHYQDLFLKQFLEKLKKEIVPEVFQNLTVDCVIEVETEKSTNKGRRMDILITCKNNTYIVIENKIYAGDQPSQIKDYVEYLNHTNKKEGKIGAENILVIYLKPFDEEDDQRLPSDYSLGKTSNRIKKYWKIENGEILDLNGEHQAYYLAMDYHWIKEWIEECIKECKSKLDQKPISYQQDNNLSIIAPVLSQYLQILDDINDEYEEHNPVIELIMQSSDNQKKAFEILGNETHEHYQALNVCREELQNQILKYFYSKLEEKFLEDEDMEWRMGWEETLKEGIFFYPLECEEELIWVNITFFYWDCNFKTPTLQIFCAEDFEDEEDMQYQNLIKREDERKEILKQAQEKLKDQGEKLYLRSDTLSKKNIFDCGEGNFIDWIVENGENAVENFIQEFKQFDKLTKPIQKQLQKHIDEI